MKRGALYGRFSTDRQNERSIEDQFATCRPFAERNDVDVVVTYEDRAVSGASMHNRPGIQELMSDARAGRFDVVVVETMSRIGRDQEERAAIRKRLRFLGIAIMTPAYGVVTDLVDGVSAVVDSQYLEDLKRATRRGLAGVVRDKRHAGGRAYGYANVKGEPGKLVVVEGQAAVVRRIFREFVDGDTARNIAKRLNAEGVAGPRGGRWHASAINGNPKRRNGIINNDLYVGKIVWNRQTFMKNPDTGLRVSRPNPPSEWITAEVPELAIVPPDLFAAAQGRVKAREGIAPHRQRKARYLLTGLLRCAGCGSGMSSYYGGRDGRNRRVRCTGDAEAGTCPAPRTFNADTIERAVVGALLEELRNPVLITEFVRTYHEERRRLASEGGARRAKAERRLGEVKREIERIVDGVAKGVLDPAIFGPRASALDTERKALEAEERPEPDRLVSLHPAALKRYEQMIGRLHAVMVAETKAGVTDYHEAIRDLVDTVTVWPGEAPGRLLVEISGRLAALLGPEAFPNGRRGGSGAMVGKVVAGAGFEPATFRL